MEPTTGGGPHHRVAPGHEVELAPVVRMVEATGGRAADLRTDRLPVTTTSLWTRADRPDPDDLPLHLHFDVKARLGFEHAVITRHVTTVRRPARLGDRIGHHQELRSVGSPRPTPLGPGRDWQIDHVLTDAGGAVLSVETYTAVGYDPRPRSVRPAGSAAPGGEGRWSEVGVSRSTAACRVWAPVHHDPAAARRAGLPGVIACTQHLAAMAEHAAVSAAGPGSVVARLELRMRRPVVAGEAPRVSVRPGGSRDELVVRVEQSGEVTTVARVVLRRP